MSKATLIVRCIFAAIALLVSASPLLFAQPKGIPPDIQAIQAKLRAGKDLTEKEEERLDKWTESLEQQAPAVAAAKPSDPNPASAQASLALKAILPCPAKMPETVALAAPSPAEYAALLQALEKLAGSRLGPGKAGLDVTLQSLDARRAWDDLHTLFMLRNMASAAIYSDAVLALRHPGDPLLANNLGAALNSIPDHKSAATVLLYAARLAPRLPQPAVNLGWVYFDSGQLASSRQWFARAAALDPTSPDPEAAEGYMAACRGDEAAASRLLASSLNKRYSGIAARVLSLLRAKEPILPAARQAKPQPPPPGTPKDPAPPSVDDLVPDLPVPTRPEQQDAVRQDLERLNRRLAERGTALEQRIRSIRDQLARLNRKAADTGGTYTAPIVQDKLFYQYGEIAHMVLPAAILPHGEALQTAGENITRQWRGAAPNYLANIQKANQLLKELQDAIRADDQARIAQLEQQSAELNYRVCLQARQDISYSHQQQLSALQTGQAALRAVAPDFYAFTQPVLDRAWQPLVHDMLEAQREFAMLTKYQQLARTALGLASVGDAFKDLKCVPPTPPPPPKPVREPISKNDGPPPCPFEKGKLAIKLVVISMELGCDSVKFEGGEGLIMSWERNFKTKEVKISAMVGLKGEAGVGVGEKAFKWEAEMQGGVEFTLQDDHVTDIALKGKFGGSMELGGLAAGGRMAGEVEGRIGWTTGPTLTAEATGSLLAGGAETGIKN